MSTAATSMYEWKTLPWHTLERRVFKLQTRIYRAERQGNRRAVHRLQRLLVTSQSAKLLATRRVTQDNRGKRTAGVDGVKSLTPPQRLTLARTLTLPIKARPTRRVWIPKPGTTEQRPLGIPTMNDRAAQALLTLALEPEWEAKFEPNSYGFRPGRSAHDAIDAIHGGLCLKPKYVLDADIAKCFDRINHTALLTKLHTIPTFRRAVRAWLRAGVMDGGELYPTEAGTPQGGVASPLLANIALHGLEMAVVAALPYRLSGGTKELWKPLVIRYADDFVVMHQDRATIEYLQQVVQTWLADMGLELKPSKTQIVHSSEGFDFLGFHVRQYTVGKTHSARRAQGKGRRQLLGCKTIIKPSKAAKLRHAAALRAIVQSHKALPQAALIRRLNPLIRGWAHYYSTVSAKVAFRTMDFQLYLKLRRWAIRRHPNKGRTWVAHKYWRLETGRWAFGTPDGRRLYQHTQMRIRRHIKVRGDKSPYDGEWSYWARRMGRHAGLPTRMTRLLRQQHGKCAHCGLYFRDRDVLEVDHTLPRSRGGTDGRANLRLLHGHCHDQKTAGDGSPARGARDKGQVIEEPDDEKLSRPVLKTSRSGD
jgi:RNA-directed DNA polymerase